MRTANPALHANTFTRELPFPAAGARVMTLQGTVVKTLILLLLTVAAAAITWDGALRGGANTPLWIAVGAGGGFVLAMITVFKQTWAPVTAPLYAILEGLFLGALSGTLSAAYPGIAEQAVALTFGTLFCLLLAYQSGLIRPSENFKLGLFAATGGVALLYLASFVMSLFGAQIPLLHDTGWMGIGLSLVIVTVAALNLVLDFDFIEQGAERGLPVYMEWYAAFGLLVTLVWLYVEFLRLLAKLSSRD